MRDYKLSDAKDLVENMNDLTMFYFLQTPHPYKLKHSKWFVNDNLKKMIKKPRKDYELAITLKSQPEIAIGGIGLNIKDHLKAHLGFVLNKDYRKQGIMTEAEEAMLAFAFNKLKMNKVYGHTDTDNNASNALFKKFGFREVGVMKEEVILNNKLLGFKNKKKDVATWELLRKDYRK